MTAGPNNPAPRLHIIIESSSRIAHTLRNSVAVSASQTSGSSHNELEKHRRAKLRLYLDQLKKLVPLGPDSTRHTTLSLLKRARMHIKKLEEQDKKALNVKEQLQREHRYLKRRLEQLSVSGSVERLRTDSMGSTISTDSEQDVDIEGMEFTPGEADSLDSISDVEEEDHYSLQSSSSDTSYTATHSHRLQPHHCTTHTHTPLDAQSSASVATVTEKNNNNHTLVISHGSFQSPPNGHQQGSKLLRLRAPKHSVLSGEVRTQRQRETGCLGSGMKPG
ncbi:unnamed protein product [Pleuronectes platessa]|uniref:BHLH domain-containing protein n=1 Tax=Pleuronectes platessa TaxID=8262 RepID=A0A9N7VK15_PLEPL|nr:unnamed protein product [Pleuronectes platessa]